MAKQKKKKKKKQHRVFWFFIKLQIFLMVLILGGLCFYYFGGYADKVAKLHSDDNYEPTELMKEREAKAKPFKVWDKVSAARPIKSCLLYTSLAPVTRAFLPVNILFKILQFVYVYDFYVSIYLSHKSAE